MRDVKIYVSPSGRRIEPFLDPVGEVPVLNRPLRDWQAQAFREAGLVLVDRPDPPCLVVPDTLLASGGALRSFVKGAAGQNAVLVLASSRFGEMSAPVQPDVTETDSGWRFEKVRFEDGTDREPMPVVVDPEEKIVETPSLRHYTGSDVIRVSMPRHPVMTIHHWVHILWANQYALGSTLRSIPRWRAGFRIFGAALRARSKNKWKVLGKLNRIGKGCDIHPTATVEGSTLGDGVRVGPYARILLSTIGDGAKVLGHAQVELSVLGERAIVSERVVLRFCVLYPEAVASQYLMQQCVLGRQAVTTGGAFSMDLNFKNTIRVPLDGELRDTGKRFLGAAFGHRSRIGTGFWLASGRAIPNDYFLIRDPATVLSKVPEGLDHSAPLIVAGRSIRQTKIPET